MTGTLHSSETSDTVKSHPSFSGSQSPRWTSAPPVNPAPPSDAEIEGSWKWSSGQQSEFIPGHWKPGTYGYEPNGNSDFMIIVTRDDVGRTIEEYVELKGGFEKYLDNIKKTLLDIFEALKSEIDFEFIITEDGTCAV